MDPRDGVILSPPNLPGWDKVPLRKMLEEWLGVKAYVEHDAAACAMAEYLWGGWGKPEVLGYLTCGTGFGLGLVVGGKPFGGAAARRPEVGHWRMREDGPTAFGKSGSAEALCSGSGLSKLAAWMFPSRWRDGIDGEELSKLASSGDCDAASVITENARYTGRVCAMLADLLTPNVITLGSLARYLGPRWLAAVEAEFARETEEAARALCRVAPCALGGRIGDLSAIAAAAWRVQALG
jgi:glucokinase